jgi:hypothetical protein
MNVVLRRCVLHRWNALHCYSIPVLPANVSTPITTMKLYFFLITFLRLFIYVALKEHLPTVVSIAIGYSMMTEDEADLWLEDANEFVASMDGKTTFSAALV